MPPATDLAGNQVPQPVTICRPLLPLPHNVTINAGGGGTMAGTIISPAGITFPTSGNTTPTTLNGRVLPLGASITMVNTVVNVPAP